MAPSLSLQVPAREPRQMSALCPLPVLTNGLTSASLTHQVIQPMPRTLWILRAQDCPECQGWSVQASRQHPSLQSLLSTHSREGAVLLVACPPSAAARDSDGQTRHMRVERTGLCTRVVYDNPRARGINISVLIML